MKKHWWKLLGVLIVAVCIVAGMLIPLKPNLIEITPGSASLGERVTVDVVGYNTRFLGADAGAVRGFLKGGAGAFLPSLQVEVIDDRRASFTFQLPNYLPEDVENAELSFFVSTSNDGTFVRPRALTVRQNNWEAGRAMEGWSATRDIEFDLQTTGAITFPFRGILFETIRNTYFHVSLWFAMLFLFTAGCFHSVRHLLASTYNSEDLLTLPLTTVVARERFDFKAVSYTGVGMLFGVLGLLTGALWAKYTWGSWWNWDIKQLTTLIALLIYAGYFVLRASHKDPEQRARISASYNVFAFVCLIPLIYVIPRVSGNSLHPGAAGNPAFGGEDLDNTMRMVFYPIIIGWTLLGFWMGRLNYRLRVLQHRIDLE